MLKMYSLQKSCHNRKNDYKKAKHTLIHTDVDGDNCKSFPLEFKMNQDMQSHCYLLLLKH